MNADGPSASASTSTSTSASARSPEAVRYTADDDLATVADDPGAGGTYVLVFEVDTPISVDVGALGTCPFPVGDYAYVGSAFGPGGFARAERHRRKLLGGDGTVHWHIDALTTRPESSFVVAHLLPDCDVECAVARRLPTGPVEGFGASDCDCDSHLSAVDREEIEEIIETVSSG